MIKINVIDLDKTLIPYDSFNKLIKNELKKGSLYLWFFTFIRVVRIVSSNNYKRIVVNFLREKYDDEYFKSYSKNIFNDIDNNVFNIVKSNSDENTINIVISASPDLYVKHLLNLLEWQGSGSYFDGRKFVHLYSKGKIDWLINKFPPHKFKYNFCISDSKSDFELFKLFDKYLFWNIENN